MVRSGKQRHAVSRNFVDRATSTYLGKACILQVAVFFRSIIVCVPKFCFSFFLFLFLPRGPKLRHIPRKTHAIKIATDLQPQSGRLSAKMGPESHVVVGLYWRYCGEMQH